MKRRRRWALIIAYFLGVRFHGTEAECQELFERGVATNGNIFFVDDEQRALENRERAAIQGNHYHPDALTLEVPLAHMFSVKANENLEEHLKLKETHAAFGGAFIADAEQTPQYSTPGNSQLNNGGPLFVSCPNLFILYCTWTRHTRRPQQYERIRA